MSAKVKVGKKRVNRVSASTVNSAVNLKNETPPAKKSRGRPPKSAGSKIKERLDEDRKIGQEIAGNANVVKGKEEAAVKKARGRPAKAKLTGAADVKNVTVDVLPKHDLPAEHKESGTPAKGQQKKVRISEPGSKFAVKRGRGRPKKVGITPDTGKNKKEAVTTIKREQPVKGKRETSETKPKQDVPKAKERGSKRKNIQKGDTK